ncbi:MAG TPA: YceI family protein [Candidatus Acidoferrales bacterium]|jgi:polyisoprenoid-binding protein YceI|nr:YceI family protein [Candidatus Acidoferrales bacterium]
MRRTVFLAVASFLFVMGVRAQPRNIDTQKSTLTIHVGKTGIFSGLGHEHEVSAPIHSGIADTGSHPAVEINVNARELRVIDKDASEKDRAEVQETMLGPDVLDSEHQQEIAFKSTGAEITGPGRWTLDGNLTLRGQTRPVKLHVALTAGHYTGETTIKLTDFGIKPPGVAGVRAKDEVKIDFDVQLAS